MKYLITFLLILFSSACFSQERGIVVHYQMISLGGDYEDTQTNLVFFGDKHVAVCIVLDKQEYYWRDSITSVDLVHREFDLDQDGQEESIGIMTYYADNGGVYKLIIRDGAPVMTTTTSQLGGRIVLAGSMSYNETTLERVEEIFGNTKPQAPTALSILGGSN